MQMTFSKHTSILSQKKKHEHAYASSLVKMTSWREEEEKSKYTGENRQFSGARTLEEIH